MSGPSNKVRREETMHPGFQHENSKRKDHLELLLLWLHSPFILALASLKITVHSLEHLDIKVFPVLN
jgi:hypothetical protein